MHRKWIHCDLKGGNILLQKLLNKKNKKFYKTHNIDWGWALPVGDIKVIQMERCAETSYHPPEAKKGIWGIFTDIYMMAGVVATIFGYNNNYGPNDSAIFQTSFTSAGLKHLGFEQLIRDCMINFLNRMRLDDYRLRPDKDQPFKFFGLLKQLKKSYQLLKRNKI